MIVFEWNELGFVTQFGLRRVECGALLFVLKDLLNL